MPLTLRDLEAAVADAKARGVSKFTFIRVNDAFINAVTVTPVGITFSAESLPTLAECEAWAHRNVPASDAYAIGYDKGYSQAVETMATIGGLAEKNQPNSQSEVSTKSLPKP